MDEFDYYLTFDKPIPYKDLEIYPVRVVDYIDFHVYVSCLLYEKNSIPNPRFIQMSYLRYLFYLAEEEKTPALYLCLMLLKLVLKVDEGEIGFYKQNDKAFFRIKGKDYDSHDFDEIKKIICIQNDIEQIDETIKKEIRDALKKAQEYKAQQSQDKVCSLEDQILCVAISSSLNIEEIYNLTIRKFSKILKRIDFKIHYEIYKSASLSGFVEFKDKNAIRHWMTDLTESDKYKDVKIDEEEMQSKIDSINNPGHD